MYTIAITFTWLANLLVQGVIFSLATVVSGQLVGLVTNRRDSLLRALKRLKFKIPTWSTICATAQFTVKKVADHPIKYAIYGALFLLVLASICVLFLLAKKAFISNKTSPSFRQKRHKIK